MESVKLNLNRDFRYIYGRGKSFVHPLLVTYIMPNRRGIVRYGITTGKKVGCAVERNRARRIIEAAARETLKNVTGTGADIVFVARTRTVLAKSHEIETVIHRHFMSCGLIESELQ